jgi:hypothetical protein
MKKLVIALIALALLSGTAFAQDKEEKGPTYVGDNATKCKMCHSEQVKIWSALKLAKAWDSLSADEQAKSDCFKCHVTGYGKPGGFTSLKDTPKLVGVQCEACHGPASDHMKAPITDKAKKKATIKRPGKGVCLTCHNKDFPNFKGFDYDKMKPLIKHWKDEHDAHDH